MNCKCWPEINEKLKAKNLRLVGAAWVMPSFCLVPKIDTEWIDRDIAPKGRKKHSPGVFASHCPFCGVEIDIPKQKE